MTRPGARAMFLVACAAAILAVAVYAVLTPPRVRT